MRQIQFRRHVLPLSALMTAGVLVLSAAPDATASLTATSALSPTAQPVTAKVAATASVTQTEASRVTEQVRAIATRRLTSKVWSYGRATARATRSSRSTATVKVTRYAPTYAAALVAAKHDATQAARVRALNVARVRAAGLARAAASRVAGKWARYRANVNVHRRFGALAVSRARAQRGKPYRWGAVGPRAFDCSGLVRYVMRSLGVKGLPRTAAAMARKAHRVAKAHKQPGDLIFFGGRHVHHVAIYAGHNMIWHSPGTGRHVQKVRIWTSSYRVGRVVA